MKRIILDTKLIVIPMLAALMILQSSCRKDILQQTATTELDQNAFWKTELDATYGLMGLYAAARPVFDRDYYMDGHGEYVRARGNSATLNNLRLGDAYRTGSYENSGYGGSFDAMYRYLYGAVNHSNYVIKNINTMMANNLGTKANLELILGETRLLRGMVYFRLISMWGDVPYLDHVIYDPTEVTSYTRMPISQVKDSIMADFTYAFDKLPVKATELGRASKPAALSFRGKLQLYWACWNKNGWPELEGFKPDAAAATAAYTAAAADFKAVMNNYQLTLYKNGDPGNIDALGKADILPNYYELFTPKANLNNPEMIMVFTHGGTGTAQGEELMRDFSGRSHEGSQCWVSPRYEIANKYQLISTGDFAPPLIQKNPTTSGSTARTDLNSAVNPNSYAGRDYRMKSTIQWDYETSIGMISLVSTGWCPFIYQTWAGKVTIGGVEYTTYNTDGCNSGYVFRKFVRNYAGQGRSDGDFAWPVMRLADVFLMYAEASNEVSGPLPDAIEAVNKVRRRGALPNLAVDKTGTKQAFLQCD
jgi:hypothetical protein